MLDITLTDVTGQPISEDAELRFSQGDRVLHVITKNGHVAIENLSDGPSQTWSLQVTTESYLPVGQFVTAPGRVIIPLPVRASKVRSVSFPDYKELPRTIQKLIFKVAYDGLSDLQRAGLLNILTKCENVLLPSSVVIDHLTDVVEIKGDRIFARATPRLMDYVRYSDRFHKVSGKLHKAPDGSDSLSSYKTSELFGNLQITFFQDGLCDIDIDDAAGIRHIFQVVKNAVTGETHPYNIHEILVGWQKLDPGYTLHV